MLALSMALLFAASAPPSGAAPKRAKKKTFKAEGTFYGVGVLTHENFIVQCPELPTTQGVDAYVVQVPIEFGSKDSIATVVAKSTTLDGVVELSLYGFGCSQGELYLKPPLVVPAGTGFIIVQDLQGANGSFELKLTQ